MLKQRKNVLPISRYVSETIEDRHRGLLRAYMDSVFPRGSAELGIFQPLLIIMTLWR